MKNKKSDKIQRVLGIYTKLISGHLVNKAEEAKNYQVNERTIQRDIDDIRNFLKLSEEVNKVIYVPIEKGYRIKPICKFKFTNSEVLALCKILLDSRAFIKHEIEDILNKLILYCVSKDDRKLIKDLLCNEISHYVEPRHKTKFMDTMWKIGQAVHNCHYIEIEYFRMKDKAIVKRKLKPVAIMFSEYYFYFTAFIDDENIRKDFDVINDSFPTIYRIDRIKKMKILEERFRIPYKSRFEEGEFRKRIQFMYGGKLQKVKFKYTGSDVDAVLDRLPTAKIISEENGCYTINAEVFGKGIDMWIRSQGNFIKIIQ